MGDWAWPPTWGHWAPRGRSGAGGALRQGVGSHRRGHAGAGPYTTLAQLVGEELGARVEDGDVVTGDAAQMGWAFGTFASRAAVVAGNAAGGGARRAREGQTHRGPLPRVQPRGPGAGGRPRAGAGRASARHVPGRGGRPRQPGALHAQFGDPGLEATRYFSLQQSTFASGAHAVVVEVDPETAFMPILRYCVVHGCRRVLKPLIVEGQIHGGAGAGRLFLREADLRRAGIAVEHVLHGLPADHGPGVAAQSRWRTWRPPRP